MEKNTGTPNIATRDDPPKNFVFNENFINEHDAFTKYYLAIRENGYISKILDGIEYMDDYCDLFEIPIKYQYESINLFVKPIPNPEHSDNILFAHNLVKLQYTAEKGRHLVVEKEVPRDTILIDECPTVLQVNPVCNCVGDNNSIYRCHNCGVACIQFFICDGCNICIFCSRSCLTRAYKDYHSYECYGFQRHFWSFEDTDYSYLAFRMLLYGASKDFVTDIQDSSRYGNFENNYMFLNKLKTNFSQMSLPQINKMLYRVVENLLYLIKKTDFFCGFDDGYDLEDIHNYVGGLLVKHYCQAQMNNLIIKFPNYTLGCGLDCISGSGKAICPTISLLNHSCSPNAAIIAYCEYMQVKSIKPIKAGEEITVCYNEVNALLTLKERRLITENILYFTCKCSFCLFEQKDSEAPYKCPLCVVGNVKHMEVKNGKHFGYCFDCGKNVSMDILYENVKIAKKIRKIYEATFSLESITRLAEIYSNIFPMKSLHSLDVYRVLYEKHVSLRENPLEVLKYGLLLFNIVEHSLSRLYLPVLIAKVRFIERFLQLEPFFEIQEIDPDDSTRNGEKYRLLAIVEETQHALEEVYAKNKNVSSRNEQELLNQSDQMEGHSIIDEPNLLIPKLSLSQRGAEQAKILIPELSPSRSGAEQGLATNAVPVNTDNDWVEFGQQPGSSSNLGSSSQSPLGPKPKHVSIVPEKLVGRVKDMTLRQYIPPHFMVNNSQLDLPNVNKSLRITGTGTNGDAFNSRCATSQALVQTVTHSTVDALHLVLCRRIQRHLIPIMIFSRRRIPKISTNYLELRHLTLTTHQISMVFPQQSLLMLVVGG